MSSPVFLDTHRHGGERPLVLGHRGSSAAFPENTLLAFRQAMAEGADGVELDVMRCGSGELVVVHDDDLGRVIGQKEGTGPDVRTTPLAELRRYDVGAGQQVPLLEEVLAELGPGALINVELKSPDVRTLGQHARLVRDDGLAESAAALLHRVGRPPGTTLVSSFDPFQLWRFHRALRRLHAKPMPLGYLFHRNQARPLREGWPSRFLPIAAIHPDAALVDAVSMRAWRRRGLFVHTWTVDDLREVAALAALGIDAIITNTPGAVVERLRQLGAGPDASAPSEDARPSS